MDSSQRFIEVDKFFQYSYDANEKIAKFDEDDQVEIVKKLNKIPMVTDLYDYIVFRIRDKFYEVEYLIDANVVLIESISNITTNDYLDYIIDNKYIEYYDRKV